jgi:hypothetical protein
LVVLPKDKKIIGLTKSNTMHMDLWADTKQDWLPEVMPKFMA